MSDFTKYLPSDEKMDRARVEAALLREALGPDSDDNEPIRTLIRTAVARAVADERARHARKIERARSLLASLVQHEEIVAGSAVRVSTSYRLAKAALEALDGEGEK